MSLNDLRQSAAAEAKAQLTTGTLKITLRRVSTRKAGFGDQAQRGIPVPCCDMPEASFGMSAGGGEASMLSRRFRVWQEDLVLHGVAVSVGKGDGVEYREHDSSGVATGAPVVAVVTETSTAMGGRCVMLECEVDRGSGE